MFLLSFPWSEFALLAAAHFLALLSPGPDFLLLVRHALRYGRRNGIGAAAGIAAGNGVMIVVALTGFSVVQQSAWLLEAFKWAAAAYLAWIGWKFIQDSFNAHAIDAAGDRDSGHVRGSFWAGCGTGFLSAALNPKNVLFYFGLFTLMVGNDSGVGLKMFYGAWMVAVVFVWDAALVCVLSHRATMTVLQRWLALVERVAGGLLIAAAAGLALWRV